MNDDIPSNREDYEHLHLCIELINRYVYGHDREDIAAALLMMIAAYGVNDHDIEHYRRLRAIEQVLVETTNE